DLHAVPLLDEDLADPAADGEGRVHPGFALDRPRSAGFAGDGPRGDDVRLGADGTEREVAERAGADRGDQHEGPDAAKEIASFGHHALAPVTSIVRSVAHRLPGSMTLRRGSPACACAISRTVPTTTGASSAAAMSLRICPFSCPAAIVRSME